MSGGSFGIKTPKNVYNSNLLNKDFKSEVLDDYDKSKFAGQQISALPKDYGEVNVENDFDMSKFAGQKITAAPKSNGEEKKEDTENDDKIEFDFSTYALKTKIKDSKSLINSTHDYLTGEGDKIENKLETTMWSSFYGGSVKHTKDILATNKVTKSLSRMTGTLIADPNNRLVSYDSDWNKYEKGIATAKPVRTADGDVVLEKINSDETAIMRKDGNIFVLDENGNYKKTDDNFLKSDKYRIKTQSLEEGDSAYGKKSTAVKIRDAVTSRLHKHTERKYNDGTGRTGFQVLQDKVQDFSKGKYVTDNNGKKVSIASIPTPDSSVKKIETVDNSGRTVVTFVDENGKSVTYEPNSKNGKITYNIRTTNGVDQYLDKKFGAGIANINRKINDVNMRLGREPASVDNVVGSDNQYRVGQNWRYGSVELYKNGKTVEGSVLGVDFSADGKYGSVSGRADLLYGKASANFELGIDHVELSASAEASILHAEIKGQTASLQDANGYLKLGADGSVSADVAKVYAKGKIGAGYYKGADGQMHLDAGIQGSIGADLCSATAKGNVDLGPIGVGGQATVKIGIGAQANLGFEDGKLNLHLGIAVGVGVELGVSLDVGRAAKAVVDFGKWICSW